MRDDLPTGTVTFLFTDVEGSTRLLHSLGAEAYAEALAEHRRIIREACATEGGVEVDTQGDAFFFAFPTAPGALAAAAAFTDVACARAVQVRVGLHTGTPLRHRRGLCGRRRPPRRAHRGGRPRRAGPRLRGEAQLVERELRDLGEHRLKDLSAPERVYQLGDGDFPALRCLYRTNLPVPATPFLGREQELAEVVELLGADDTRLLTLTGPGGTGKTRLALQAAGLASDAYPDGVYWIPLAPLRDPTLVLATAGQTLGSKNGLAEHISDKAMLCLFDNFEQVVDAGTELAGLLAECPNLDVLVTSRERLRVSGEQTYPVPPLAESDGEALFTARARAVDPAFTPSESVRELCLRLDELPLALELAAARTALFSPEQLLGQALAAPRPAQGLPRRRSAAADAARDDRVVVRPPLRRREAPLPPARGLLGRLHLRSCRGDRRGRPGHACSRCSTRASCASATHRSAPATGCSRRSASTHAEQLEESAEAERLARRHLAYYLALAEDVDERSKVGEYELGRLEEERDNLRSAFDTALALEPEQALDLAGRLALYWNPRGHWSEGRQRLAAALAAAPAAPPSARVRALSEAGYLAFWQTDLDDAEQLGREALALAREHGDRSGSGYALNLLGGIVGVGDPIAAIEYYEESLAEYEAAGDERGRLHLLQNFASNAVGRGDYQRAISLLRDKIASTGSRDTYSLALAVGLLGFALAGNGENEEARQSFEKSLEMCRAHGFSRAEAEILSGLADLMRTAHPAQALEYYRESIELAWTIGLSGARSPTAFGASPKSHWPAEMRETQRRFSASSPGSSSASAASFNPDGEGTVSTRRSAQAREALGNDAFDAAWAEGGGLSLDQAVDLSLTVTASGEPAASTGDRRPSG